MMNAPQGLHGFLRGYFHGKSADWPGNDPKPLAAWTAEEIAPMPTYYIMDRDKDMAETSATFMPTPEEIASCHWLPEDELAFSRKSMDGLGSKAASIGIAAVLKKK